MWGYFKNITSKVGIFLKNVYILKQCDKTLNVNRKSKQERKIFTKHKLTFH